jgi:ketosteroid isomerase-like protein
MINSAGLISYFLRNEENAMNALQTMLSGSLLVLLALPSIAAAAKPADEVRQAEDKWITAIKVNDRAALEKILSGDLVYTHSTGLVEDKAQYIAAVTSGNQKYASVTYENPLIRVFGATAVVTTKARMTGSTKGTPFDNQLRLLHVWVHQAGSWVLVAHQTTRLPG